MTATDTRTCRDCGGAFTRSPADVTVRCPACRAGGKAKRPAACVVCEGTGTVTHGPSAVDGTYTTHSCHRCG